MSEQQGDYKIEQRKREFAVLRQYAAMRKATEETIGCQKIYVDIAGGIMEAFVLDELIFFTLPRPETGKSGLRVWKDGVLWMAVSRAEWWERKRITPKQADGAIERLVKSGLVYKDLFLFNKQKTTHLRLNTPEFFRRYKEELEKQNPPEDDNDTVEKDIADLYEMLGIPKSDTPEGIPFKDTCLPNGDTVSPKGDSINSPDTSSTQPFLGADAPALSLENQIYAGVERVVVPDNEQARRVDFANLVAMNTTNPTEAREIALAFQNTRNITLPTDEKKVKGQRKAIKEMLEMGVKFRHVIEATKKLIADGMTVSDLYSVIKKSIDIANPATPALVQGTTYTDSSGIPLS